MSLVYCCIAYYSLIEQDLVTVANFLTWEMDFCQLCVHRKIELVDKIIQT